MVGVSGGALAPDNVISFLQQKKLLGKDRDMKDRILRNAMTSNRCDIKSSAIGSAKLSTSMIHRSSGQSLL